MRRCFGRKTVHKIKKCVLFFCCVLLLSGCKKESEQKTPPTEKIEMSSLKTQKGAYSRYENECTYYTPEEARTIVAESTEFLLTEDCYFRVPKEMDHISTFVKRYPEQDSLYDFYKSFLTMYTYLFPEGDFDDNHLFFYGANSNNQEGDDKVKTIGRNFEEFLAEEKEDVYYLFYSPYFYEGQERTEGTQNRFLELSSPVGTILTNFNKGFLAEYISKMKHTPNEYFLETYTMPAVFIPYGVDARFDATAYPVDSDAVHTMLDGKQLSVREAVAFFEDYINTLPYPEQPNLDIQVTRVEAVEIEDGKYCYSFECATAFEGIPFDSVPYGTFTVQDGHEASVSMGYMAVTNDVDAAYGFGRSVEISQKEDVKQMISLQDALNCCEESLSDLSGMELVSAELVYCAGEERIPPEPYQNMEYTVTPNYKFVLYHPEESLHYFSYVDAISGEFVRGFKTKINE